MTDGSAPADTRRDSDTAPPGWEGLLDPGERILWQGQPDGTVVWKDIAQLQSLMGVFFTGFAIFWIAMAGSMTGSMPTGSGGYGQPSGPPAIFRLFPLFGIPFVLVGLNMLVGRLFVDAWKRRHTTYTLTDRAAFIATSAFGKRKLDRHEIGPQMQITFEDGDPGTVWFAEKLIHNSGGWAGHGETLRYSPPSTTRKRIGFRRIHDARKVHRMLRDAITARRKEAG